MGLKSRQKFENNVAHSTGSPVSSPFCRVTPRLSDEPHTSELTMGYVQCTEVRRVRGAVYVVRE